MREFAKSQKNMAKVKRGNLQRFGINHLAKKENYGPTQFFCRAFLLPACRVNVRGKFIPAEALRSRRLCMAARSLAAGVFAGKNGPKGIDGVPRVDRRLIGKNTNKWEGIDGVSGVDGRPMGSS